MAKKINKKAVKIKNSKEKINKDLNDVDYDEKNGRLAFSSVSHNKCPISSWQGDELILLIDAFKKFESEKWKDIFTDPGLKWERNSHIAFKLPRDLPEDIKLYSFRVSSKMRLYGYRAQEFFYIIWFDRNHEVCPMGRRKTYNA